MQRGCGGEAVRLSPSAALQPPATRRALEMVTQGPSSHPLTLLGRVCFINTGH